MPRADVSDYLDLKQMPPGRHVFALTTMRAIVVDKLGSTSPVVPVFDDAIAQGRETLSVEFSWEAVKKTKENRSRGPALPLKRAIARRLSSLHSILQGRAEGEDDVAVKARELIALLFPNGVAGISNKKFELMLGRLQTMRDQLQGKLADHVEEVGVGREVRLLAELTARFGEALLPPPAKLSHDDVETAQHALHEATSEVVIEILRATSKRNFVPPEGSEPMSDVARIRLREEILAPLNFQQELVAEAYSQHKIPLDVNPETGEEIDPDADDDDANDDGNLDANIDANDEETEPTGG